MSFLDMNKLVFLAASIFLISGSSFANDKNVVNNNDSNNEDDMPKFEISGSASVHSSFSNPDVKYHDNQKGTGRNGKKTEKDSSMTRFSAGDAEVVFAANGKLNNGWLYGAKISLNANKGDTGVDKMYVTFARDNIGTLVFGNIKGPEALFLSSGQQLLGGTTCLDGTVSHDIDFATGTISPLYVQGYTNKATKLGYYTPVFGGFQFGFAITPDTKHIGHNDKDSRTGNSNLGNTAFTYLQGKDEKEKPSGRNNMSFGLKHEYKFNDNLSSKVSLIYLMEDTKPINIKRYQDNTFYSDSKIKLRNASSYHATASITYKDFTVGCGYLNNGKSRLPKKSEYLSDDMILGGFLTTKESNAGQAWNIGARYIYGKWAFATVFHRMERKVQAKEKTKGNAICFTTDYTIVKGLKFFGEIDYVNTKSSNKACEMYNLVHDDKIAIKKQKTVLFVLGAKVSF